MPPFKVNHDSLPAGLASFPPGACSMLWEASVAGLTSVAVMATGPGMHTLAGALPALCWHAVACSAFCKCSWPDPQLTRSLHAGILVVARPNISLPGYRQHLGQALVGAYDMALDASPDRMRPTYCR